jgi:hypothetical protein
MIVLRCPQGPDQRNQPEQRANRGLKGTKVARARSYRILASEGLLSATLDEDVGVIVGADVL